MQANSMKLTFLVPSDCYSGGVRVTMQMGNCLLERGHRVRIAFPKEPLFSRSRAVELARTVKYRCQGLSETRWLKCFRGQTEGFKVLADLKFDDQEVVISTGIHTLEELQLLEKNVLKLRFCHGLLEQEPEERRKLWLWRGSMATIAVSSSLLPPLEKICEGRILGVVPNGIDPRDYFVETRQRDGVGLIYSGHPVKGPEVALEVVAKLRERYPQTPFHIFGSYPCPSGFGAGEYTRFPAVEKARELYNRCKIWLVTSRDEGFCLPILEAMACGCAVITSNHTNAKDLIEQGVNGITVEYGDVAGYVNAVGSLLNDEERRTRLVNEGFKTVKQYTWEEAANRMEEALRKLN
jgi:glycosyltransferase involved in cell wall biosynthesis